MIAGEPRLCAELRVVSLREHFGLAPHELNLDLGPLGSLLPREWAVTNRPTAARSRAIGRRHRRIAIAGQSVMMQLPRNARAV